MVEMWDGWNSLSVNLHNKHVFPTPESPRSRSRKSTSYCLAIVFDVVLIFLEPRLTNWAMEQSLPTCIPCLLRWSTQGLGFASFCSLAVGRWATKQGCSSFPCSLQLPVGAVDHCHVTPSDKMRLPVVLFNTKSTVTQIICENFAEHSDILYICKKCKLPVQST